MAKGVKHYKRDGTEYKGGTHKMPNGEVHSGKTHGKTSVKLFHLKDLSKKAQEKANVQLRKEKEKGPLIPTDLFTGSFIKLTLGIP